MVTAYWNIGKLIFEICGESDRAPYGKQVLKYISERMTAEFGKGFSVQGLRNMRQFYLAGQPCFSKTLRAEERIELVSLSSAYARCR